MPTNSTARIAAMTISVVAALRDSGGLNAGTPVAIASVPVSATGTRREGPQEQDQSDAARPSLLRRATTSGVGAAGLAEDHDPERARARS